MRQFTRFQKLLLGIFVGTLVSLAIFSFPFFMYSSDLILPANVIVSKTVDGITNDFLYKPDVGKFSPFKFEPQYASFPATVGYHFGFANGWEGTVIEVTDEYAKIAINPSPQYPLRGWFP